MLHGDGVRVLLAHLHLRVGKEPSAGEHKRFGASCMLSDIVRLGSEDVLPRSHGVHGSVDPGGGPSKRSTVTAPRAGAGAVEGRALGDSTCSQRGHGRPRTRAP